MDYLVTFYDQDRELETRKMNTDDVLKMYEQMLNNERFNDKLVYPSHLFTVEKLILKTDNS
jgi:hypothetical protein